MKFPSNKKEETFWNRFQSLKDESKQRYLSNNYSSFPPPPQFGTFSYYSELREVKDIYRLFAETGNYNFNPANVNNRFLKEIPIRFSKEPFITKYKKIYKQRFQNWIINKRGQLFHSFKKFASNVARKLFLLNVDKTTREQLKTLDFNPFDINFNSNLIKMLIIRKPNGGVERMREICKWHIDKDNGVKI